jgi:hypothetical protein
MFSKTEIPHVLYESAAASCFKLKFLRLVERELQCLYKLALHSDLSLSYPNQSRSTQVFLYLNLPSLDSFNAIFFILHFQPLVL